MNISFWVSVKFPFSFLKLIFKFHCHLIQLGIVITLMLVVSAMIPWGFALGIGIVHFCFLWSCVFVALILKQFYFMDSHLQKYHPYGKFIFITMLVLLFFPSLYSVLWNLCYLTFIYPFQISLIRIGVLKVFFYCSILPLLTFL